MYLCSLRNHIQCLHKHKKQKRLVEHRQCLHHTPQRNDKCHRDRVLRCCDSCVEATAAIFGFSPGESLNPNRVTLCPAQCRIDQHTTQREAQRAKLQQLHSFCVVHTKLQVCFLGLERNSAFVGGNSLGRGRSLSSFIDSQDLCRRIGTTNSNSCPCRARALPSHKPVITRQRQPCLRRACRTLSRAFGARRRTQQSTSMPA